MAKRSRGEMSPAEAMLRGVSLEPLTSVLGLDEDAGGGAPAKAGGNARLLVYVPDDMRRRIRVHCAERDMTVSAFAREAFEAALEDAGRAIP